MAMSTVSMATSGPVLLARLYSWQVLVSIWQVMCAPLLSAQCSKLCHMGN